MKTSLQTKIRILKAIVVKYQKWVYSGQGSVKEMGVQKKKKKKTR